MYGWTYRWTAGYNYLHIFYSCAIEKQAKREVPYNNREYEVTEAGIDFTKHS